MDKLRSIPALLLLGSLSFAPALLAQRDQPEPLTPAQQQAIAEAGIDPAARIGLYTKYLDERADTIKHLIPRPEAARGRRIDRELQYFSALIDELSSNLDEYGGRNADLRKGLKPLNESLPHWQDLLRDLPKDPTYEITRKDASDALSDLANEAKQLTQNQDEYFKEHKDAKGQDRAEPE